MTLEEWNLLFKGLSIGLAAATFAVGALTVITDQVLAKRQSERITGQSQRIAAAEKETAEARKEAAEATLAAAGAAIEVNKTKTELAAQQERAAKAEHALLELKEWNKPRELNAEQQKRFVEILSKFAGQRLDVFGHEQQKEVSDIANLLTRSLHSAGWKVRAWDVTGAGSVAGIEIRLQSGADGTVVAIAGELVKALRDSGLAANMANLPFTGDNPPGFALGGRDPWNKNEMAPIRMHVGTKH